MPNACGRGGVFPKVKIPTRLKLFLTLPANQVRRLLAGQFLSLEGSPAKDHTQFYYFLPLFNFKFSQIKYFKIFTDLKNNTAARSLGWPILIF